jgi:hypothetical protein
MPRLRCTEAGCGIDQVGDVSRLIPRSIGEAGRADADPFEQIAPLVFGIVLPGDHPSYLGVRGKKTTLQRTYPHIDKKSERDASHPPPKTARFGRPEDQKPECDREIKNAAQDRDIPLTPHDFLPGLATRLALILHGNQINYHAL